MVEQPLASFELTEAYDMMADSKNTQSIEHRMPAPNFEYLEKARQQMRGSSDQPPELKVTRPKISVIEGPFSLDLSSNPASFITPLPATSSYDLCVQVPSAVSASTFLFDSYETLPNSIPEPQVLRNQKALRN